MADYYREFSSEITNLTKQEQEWWEREIAEVERLVEGPSADQQDADDFNEENWPELNSPGMMNLEGPLDSLCTFPV